MKRTIFRTGYTIDRFIDEPCLCEARNKQLIYSGTIKDIPADIAAKATGNRFELMTPIQIQGTESKYTHCIIYKNLP